jgi:hypothetical protein
MNHGRTPDPGDRRYGWNVIDMNIFGGNNNPHSPAALEATMLHVHSTTQNILVSRYGYGR